MGHSRTVSSWTGSWRRTWHAPGVTWMRSWRPTWPRRRPRSQHDQGQVSGRAHEGGAHSAREPQLPSPGHAVPHDKLLPDGLEELLQQLEVGDTCRQRFWTCDLKKRDLKKHGLREARPWPCRTRPWPGHWRCDSRHVTRVALLAAHDSSIVPRDSSSATPNTRPWTRPATRDFGHTRLEVRDSRRLT